METAALIGPNRRRSAVSNDKTTASRGNGHPTFHVGTTALSHFLPFYKTQSAANVSLEQAAGVGNGQEAAERPGIGRSGRDGALVTQCHKSHELETREIATLVLVIRRFMVDNGLSALERSET